MVDASRYFLRTTPHGIITDEMKEMERYDLLEYTGQLYRRIDRIVNILRRHEEEGVHTLKSLVWAIGKQSSTEYIRGNAGYYIVDGDSHEE